MKNFRDLYYKYAFYIIAGFLIYIFLFKLLPILIPFIIAAILAIIIDPLIEYLIDRFNIPRGISALIVILLFVLIIFFLLSAVVTQIISELNKLVNITLPDIYIGSNTQINSFLKRLTQLYNLLPENIISLINQNLTNLKVNLYGVLKTTIMYILSKLSNISYLFMVTLITLISTYFMSKDKFIITGFILKQIPEKWARNTRLVKKDLLDSIAGYIRAEIVMILLTFLESSIGLFFIGFDYAFLIGLLISLVDALPILGSGIIFIPWGLIVIFIYGNFKTGLYILIIYCIVLLSRQLIEPNLISSNIGLHPLVTIISMFVGFKVIGFWGLILGPIFVIFIKAMQKAGLIPPFKN